MALTRLTGRKLLRIAGPDCYPYLQGILCNDLRYLYEVHRIPERKHANKSVNSLSTFMLNPQGRAICDLILYRTPRTRFQCEFTPPGQAKEDDELWIECDSELASGIANTLYGYRVRRKITLKVDESYSIWCLYPYIENKTNDLIIDHKSELARFNPSLDNEIVSYEMTLVHDPRLRLLGLRIITTDFDPKAIIERMRSLMDIDIKPKSCKEYQIYRYFVGLGEGAKDHPESSCLPLECNADHLGSVSFDKGCYLGQELTARIKFTGVIRKRLMPIKVESQNADKPLLYGSDILDSTSGKKVGILRHTLADRGLGLLRIDHENSNLKLIHGDTKTELTTYRPFWWKQN